MNNNNTLSYLGQYEMVLYKQNTLSYDYAMSDLRTNLQHEMDLKGWNAYDLSNASGVPQPTIHRFLSGKHGDPRTTTIVKLATGLGVTEEKLRGFAEQHHYAVNDVQSGYYEEAQPPSSEFTPVHYANIKLSAGVNGFEVDYHEEAMQPIFFRHDWLSSKGFKASKLIACEITGDSMEPRLYSGDSVVINTESNDPIDGKVFAVNYEGELVIKRLYRDNGNWYLRSDNPDKTRYSDKNCASDICIMIGEVVHRQSTEI